MAATPTTETQPEFKRLQYAFTGHLRDPENQPAPPEVDSERMGIYRRLVYGNIEAYISRAYSGLRAYYSDDDWQALVRDFFVKHRSHSAQFYRAAEEFLAFLMHERGEHPEDPPFMCELAHYEWLELVTYILDAEADLTAIDTNGDLLTGSPVVSPLVQRAAYQYPVDALDKDNPPTEPPETPTHLLVYRDLQDETQFFKLNAITAHLLERLQQSPELTGQAHLEAIANDMQHPQPEVVINGGAQILADLKARDVILGTRRV